MSKTNKYYYKLVIDTKKKDIAQVNGLIDKLSERFTDLDYSNDKKIITFNYTGPAEKLVKYNLTLDAILYVECDDPIIRARYAYQEGKMIDQSSYFNFFEAGTFGL